MRGELIDDAAALESLRGEWDALAERVGAPFGAPGWAEAWWAHMAPTGARLAVVAVRDGNRLIGLAPLYVTRALGVTEARLLGGGWASRLGILAEEGSEEQVAAAIAAAFATGPASPDIIHWEGIQADSPWPGLLSAASSGGFVTRTESERAAPVLRMAPMSYDDWFMGKGSHFRGHMRRDRRKIEKQGAVFRVGDAESLEADLAAFERLHSARRADRGGSSAVGPEAMTALRQAGATLQPLGRFGVWLIDDPEGVPICAQVFVRAGTTVAFWNTGFDDEWRKYSPGALTVLTAIEDAFARGDELMDLGGGEARYKDRLSDEDRPIAWVTSYRRGARYPLARMRRLPGLTARRGATVLRERLGQERLGRLRSKAAKLRRS